MTPLKKLDIPELLQMFVQAAQTYEEAINRGSAKDANRQHGIIDRAFQELHRRGAERELLPLLTHSQPIVREAAAVYALRFAPELGEPILEELATHGTGVAAMNAGFSLQRWREQTAIPTEADPARN